MTNSIARATALARQVGTDFGAALTVALAFIGDRLGLFRLLASGQPMTSAQIAQQGDLNERYVREWAATMAAAGYLEYQPADASFRMTAEQAMVLSRDNGNHPIVQLTMLILRTLELIGALVQTAFVTARIHREISNSLINI